MAVHVFTDTAKSSVYFAIAILNAFTNSIINITSYALFALTIVLISAILTIFMQYGNELLFHTIQMYNDDLSPKLQIIFIWPIKLLNMILRALIPIWNLVWWLWKKVPNQVLLQTVTHDFGLVVNIVESAYEFFKASAFSVVGWLSTFVCCVEDNGMCNPQCMNAGSRLLDLMTPMNRLRVLLAFIVKWVGGWCTVMRGPIDLVTFPFMDINLAKFVHFGGNTILYTFVHLPAITYDRCRLFGGTIDCVPDFSPIFTMGTKAVHFLGLVVDNWLDITLLIIEATLNIQSPKCDTLPTLLAEPTVRAAVFGANKTSIVGLTNTMFARTDGVNVQYFSTASDWQSMIHPNAFPFKTNVAYGIAAVTHIDGFNHDANGDDRVDLLGCACYEEEDGIKILCGVAMQTDQISSLSRTIDVQFQLPSTAKAIATCSRIDIAVETMRWPQTRHTQSGNPVTAREKVRADAAVWIKPRCSATTIDIVCVESFKAAACFPYCMALHLKGSGSQTMILHDALEWNQGLTMLDRDCAVYNVQEVSQIVNTYQPPVVVLNDKTYNLHVQPTSMTCLYNSQTYSFTNRTTEYLSHDTINLESQPFLFSGDLALTAVGGQLASDGTRRYFIQVQRIWGNQLNEFTIIPFSQPIPASEPCLTPQDCANVQCNPSCLAAVPYAFNMNIVAATSDRYVYWVANPTLEPFYAMAYYCQNKDSTNILQISATSSYGGIRLWRVDPYKFCPLDPVTNKYKCPSQQSSTTRLISALDFSGFNTDLCTKEFDVHAVSLDYINEYNLAMVVLRTSLGNVNIDRMEPVNQSLATYVTLWINTDTMEAREDEMWSPEGMVVAAEDGMLCPSQRRMPNIGSLYASAINTIVFFVRMPLFVVTYLPVMQDFQCPIVSHGHGILQTCGPGLFSLDDMFFSLYEANAHFWRIFSIIANAFGPGPPQTFINGVTMFGQGQWNVIRPPLVSSFLKIGSVDAGKAISVLQNSFVGLPPPIAVAQSVMTNPVAVAHVYYLAFSRMMIHLLDGQHTLNNVFWNAVADGIADWDTIVLQRMRQSCGGIALMTGYETPLGMLMLQWCNANVDWLKAGPTMSSIFFVDIPLMACVCTQSSGREFNTHVIDNCYKDAPDSKKPLLIALLDSNAAVCPVLVNMTKSQFSEVLDEMFANLEGGTRQLGSVIDSFIGDAGSGQCDNYETNPFVLSLMPQPVDYWRVCGKTQRCRLLCYDSFVAFEQVRQDFTVTETVTSEVQSLFFNSNDQDTYVPVRPLALLEIYNCTVPCGNVQPGDRCFALIGEKIMLQIIHYCVPIDIGSNVRRAREPKNIGAVNEIMGLQIIYNPEIDDFYASFKALVMTHDKMYVCYDECVQLWTTEDLSIKSMREFYVLGNRIILQAVVTVNEFMQTATKTFCSLASIGISWPEECEGDLWPRVDVANPICMLNEKNTCDNLILVPKNQQGVLESCTRTKYMSLECDIIPMAKSFLYNANLGLMSRTGKEASSVWTTFAVNQQTSHWLQLSKLFLNSNTARASSQSSLDATVSLNIMRKCSLDNCIGCTDLSVQRLCYAALQCQLARCVGTMINQNRPLCAIGMYVQALVAQHLSVMEGSWLRMSESLTAAISIASQLDPPREITWPDQEFYGYICASKDISATFISIAVASVNGLVQVIVNDPSLNYRQQWTNDAMAQYTMVLASTTNFLNQLALYPLYNMIAVQKTFICSANSVISLVTPGLVTIGDSAISNYSSRGAGQCLSQYFSESMYGQGSGNDNVQTLLTGAVQNMRLSYVQRGLEVMIHPLDAMFTWLEGVVLGIQDIIQTADNDHCKLPNFAVTTTFKCACNDNSFTAIEARKNENWQQQAFWCSTTMSMLDANGKTKYVWNPYSLQQLKNLLSPKLDPYLKCLGTQNQCTPPSATIFDEQQIPLLAVYQRCLSNYQAKIWDAGTWLMFNDSARSMLPSSVPTATSVASYIKDLDLHDCLQKSKEAGSDNTPCLNQFLSYKNINALDYFEYSATSSTASVNVDACEVFSGPAKLESNQVFRDCLNGYEQQGSCKMPGILWSGRSQNKVPVASLHSTKIQDALALQQAALNAYNNIKATVDQALKEIEDWTAQNVQVSIFSAEGDLLHQFFDCMMMGALGRTKLWPVPDTLSTPIWSRQTDGSDSREFELPCADEQLKDRTGTRDTNSPFTCGSYPRRAAIKYFIRSRQSSDEQLTANRALITKAVQDLLETLKSAWGDINNYYCQCADGTRGFDCCTLPESCDPETKCPCSDGSPPAFACCDCEGGSLLPAQLQTKFTSIPGSVLVDSLFDEIASFSKRDVFLSNNPWLLWDATSPATYVWDATAHEYMVYDTTQPVRHYDELGTPWKTTIWEQCHGLLEQIYYTMPMSMQNIPTTAKTPYDPDQLSQTVNLTYREEFVQALVRDAYAKSPLFWQYSMRHVPSDSVVCKHRHFTKSKLQQANIQGTKLLVHGYSAFTLGAYEDDCFCGWWEGNSCRIPSDICADLVQLVSTDEIISICNNGRVAGTKIIELYMRVLAKVKGGWMWPCSTFNVSDMWGVMNSAWVAGATDTSDVWDRILRNGTSGLRVGSLQWVAENVPLDPLQRINSLHDVAQTCDIDIKSISDHFIDDLFPALQGVRNNVALNACLRFTIELARLHFFQINDLTVSIAEQEKLVSSWRRKCEQKLQHVSFCSAFGVFDIMHVSNTTCTFTVLPYFEQQNLYSLTRNCLIVYKTSSLLPPKVYDPCLCGQCYAQNINLITMAQCGPTSLTCPVSCEIMHVQDIVLDDGLPVYPASSDTASAVPTAWARSRAMENLPDNVANNKGRWDTAEGNMTTVFCDMMVDWWPDSWLHPVGFHVTFPCRDGVPRTFDASWAYLKEGDRVTLKHVQALHNATQYENEFGGAGPCRTHNYGMPMHTINTIRVCTKHDKQKYDPTVPPAAFANPDWNTEFCSESPYDVPWTNGPTSVGTLFDYYVDLVDTQESDIAYKTCTADSDCCAACKCFIGVKAFGVCVVRTTGQFECAQHKHCSGGLMCSGEGLCVKGMIQVTNNFTENVTSNVFSDTCSGSDTWGVSNHENIPDILRASGVCSYRSWYEHRNLPSIENAQCTSDTCLVNRDKIWYSTNKPAKSIFETEILKIKPHACDRDYEHMRNLKSCAPSQSYMVNKAGLSQSIQRGVVTQTYRPNGNLEMVLQDDRDNKGFGFSGTKRLYETMGYTTASQAGLSSSVMKPCSVILPCTLQADALMWYVNGELSLYRNVTVKNSVRRYALKDVEKCGSMGFVYDTSKCMIDPAVVPLFYIHCDRSPTASICSKYRDGKYDHQMAVAGLQGIADDLNALLETTKQTVNTFSQYLNAVDLIISFWDKMEDLSVGNFPEAKVYQTYQNERPKTLYWLLTYSAYEIPFSYWFRCGWLSGFTFSNNPITCTAWDDRNFDNTTTNTLYDTFDAADGTLIPLISWLAALDGVYTTADVQALRNQIHESIVKTIQDLEIERETWKCYTRTSYIDEFLETSTDYLSMAKQLTQGFRSYTQRNITNVCDSFATCYNHTNPISMQNDIINDVKQQIITTGACTQACYTNVVPPFQNLAQDLLPDLVPEDSKRLAMFRVEFPDIFLSAYDTRPNGCDVLTSCVRPTDMNCKCATKYVTQIEIESSTIKEVKESERARLVFSKSNSQILNTNDDIQRGQNNAYLSLDVCGLYSESLAYPPAADNCVKTSNVKADSLRDSYCTITGQKNWSYINDEFKCIYKVSAQGNMVVQNTEFNIGGTTITIPEYVDTTVFVVNPLRCYELTCDYPLTYLNGRKVAYLQPYQKNIDLILNMEFYDLVDWEGNIFVEILTKTPLDTYEPIANGYIQCQKIGTRTTETMKIPKDCLMNVLKTRPISNTFFETNWDSFSFTPQNDSFSVDVYKTLVKTIVNLVEPKFAQSTNNKTKDCEKADAQNLDLYCQFADAKYTAKLRETHSCSQDERDAFCVRKYTSVCDKIAIDHANYWKDTFECDWKSVENNWLLIKEMYKCPEKAKRFRTYENEYNVKFRDCMKEKADGICKKMKCVLYQYAYTTKPLCTGNPTQCFYTQANETELLEAGLPNVGFCPDCIGPSCSSTKSSYTYQTMKTNIDTFSIVPSKSKSGAILNDNAKWFSWQMAQGYKCNNIQCPSRQKQVQVRKNLYTCLPCIIVPEPFCTGNHLCHFESNKPFQQIVDETSKRLKDLVKDKVYSITSKWKPFLRYPKKYKYVPASLARTYNAMMESLNGVCGSTSSLPDLTSCRNDNPRRKLRSHYERKFKVSSGYVVPVNHSLIWYVDSGQLLRTNIMSFSSTMQNLFVKELLDDNVCGRATLDSLVCFRNGDAFDILNPVTMGDFEIQEGCDVISVDGSRVIDSYCPKTICGMDPVTKASLPDGSDLYNTFSGTNYKDMTKQTQCGARHGQTARYLSTRSSYEINLCSKQPSYPASCPATQTMIGGGSGSPVADLYAYSAWPSSRNEAGLFVNPVLKSITAEYGNVTLKDTDIAGHFLRMKITAAGKYVFFDAPIRSYPSLPSALSANTSAWITEFKQARDINTYTLKTCQTWSCPFQRLTFWTGKGKVKPVVPDPTRTQVLYDNALHPTTRRQANAWLGAYHTRDGFCFCPKGAPCSTCQTSDAVQALVTLQYRLSKVTQTPCSLQSDWPYTGGPMRDESWLDPKTGPCHVLDRIPPFQFRYHNSQVFLKSTVSTIEEGGACHMGRPAQYTAGMEHCTLKSKTKDSFILQCGSETKTIPRPKSIETQDKRPCSECAPLPQYQSASGNTIPSEVSYGQIWRWSPARLLARDLRFRLCGNATTCPAAASWTLNTFWPNMFSEIKHLFNIPKPAPEDVWSTNWMLCTGKNAQTCHGSYSKDQWLRDKTGTCKQILKLPNSGDAVRDLPICNLDNRLDSLCRTIQNARYKVFEANCQITGSCRTSSFFYQPGTYNLLNREFVRDTVGYFYNFTEPGSCPVMDVESQQVLNQNRLHTSDCAAQDLESLRLAISMARSVAHLFVEIYFYVAKIAINILSLLLGGDTSDMISRIFSDFQMIVQRFMFFFQQIGDLAFKLVTETGQLGRALRNAIKAVCNFLNDVLDKFIRPLVCAIREAVLGIFWFFRQVASVFGSGAYDEVDKFRNKIINDWDCDVGNPIDCSILDDFFNTTAPATLPTPTRCWVGDQSVNPNAGCQASDTCSNDDGSLVACAACSNSANMVRFGCNSITKQCQCHVFPQDQTSCTSHEECYLPDVGCSYMDAYLQPGFGNIPCTQCTTQAQCLYTHGRGQCVCMLRPYSFQSCSASGSRVVPDATKLCLYSGGSSLSNARYVTQYRTLASVACATINQAQSFCMQVYLSADTSALLTVGTAILQTSRRLLSITAPPANFTLEPCKSVMMTEDKRPLEQYLASECERWYGLGEYLIVHYNISDARADEFTTGLGLLKVVVTNPHALQILVHILQHTEHVGPIVQVLVNATATLFQRPAVRQIMHWYNRTQKKHRHIPIFVFVNASRNATVPNTPNVTLPNVTMNHTGNRRLLQTWKDQLAPVQQYSIAIASGQLVSVPNPQEWNTGPFNWPPSYEYWDTEHPCLVIELLFNYTVETVSTTLQFYQNEKLPRPQLPDTFYDSLPSLPKTSFPRKPLPGYLELFKDYFDIAEMRHYFTRQSNGAPSQLAQDIRSMFSCNFQHMQICSGQKRRLLWSAAIVLVFFLAVATIGRTIGLSGTEVMLFMLFVPALAFFTYSYSIFCFPMIPTCVGNDLVEIIEMFFPVTWQWPDAMQRWPNCIGNASAYNSKGEIDMAVQQAYRPGTADCILSCQEWPFEYNRWQDNLAWFICDFSVCDPEAQWLHDWQRLHDQTLGNTILNDYLTPAHLQQTMRVKSPLTMLSDKRTAQRICATISIVNLFPVLLLSVVLIVLSSFTISLSVSSLLLFFNMLFSIIIFTHLEE